MQAFYADHFVLPLPPGLVVYVSGADTHEGDRLGRLKLTAAGLAERDRRVLGACRAACASPTPMTA